MSARPANRSFASRLGDPESWVRAPEPSAATPSAGDRFTALLTIDVTPELRARIKITAFQRGQTVADMLRDLLAREYPATNGGQT
jgi:bacterioferritin (cytochrome b1)